MRGGAYTTAFASKRYGFATQLPKQTSRSKNTASSDANAPRDSHKNHNGLRALHPTTWHIFPITLRNYMWASYR